MLLDSTLRQYWQCLPPLRIQVFFFIFYLSSSFWFWLLMRLKVSQGCNWSVWLLTGLHCRQINPQNLTFISLYLLLASSAALILNYIIVQHTEENLREYQIFLVSWMSKNTMLLLCFLFKTLLSISQSSGSHQTKIPLIWMAMYYFFFFIHLVILNTFGRCQWLTRCSLLLYFYTLVEPRINAWGPSPFIRYALWCGWESAVVNNSAQLESDFMRNGKGKLFQMWENTVLHTHCVSSNEIVKRNSNFSLVLVNSW